MAQLLSVKPQDTLAAAERQAEELAAAKQRMTELEDQLFSLRAQALTDRGDLLLLEPPTRPDGARRPPAVWRRCSRERSPPTSMPLSRPMGRTSLPW